MSYLHGKFVWFEHHSGDIGSARVFYGALFGWGTDPVPIGEGSYHMIQNRAQGIGGLCEDASDTDAHWISYLSVADVDAAVAAADAAGASVRMPPTDFGPMGRGARIADPVGVEFCVWKDREGDRPDTGTIASGDWYWNECMTPDPQRSLDFYCTAFGFGRETTTGAKGPYHLLTVDGKPRAGLMKTPHEQLPSLWVPYVSVSDCDASAEKAAELGGQVHAPPMDVPEVGRIAVLGDPLGAMFGIIRGTMTG